MKRRNPALKSFCSERIEIVPGDVGSFRADGHDRLISPLNAIAFASIALAVLVSSSFSRRGQTGRLLAAIGVMVLCQASGIAMKNLAAKNPALVPLMYMNVLLPIAVGLYWTFRGPVVKARRAQAQEAEA